jgi:hypothetical protein
LRSRRLRTGLTVRSPELVVCSPVAVATEPT